MTTVGVAELRQNLSCYLRLVEQGERLVVTERNRPVAELGPHRQPVRHSIDSSPKATFRDPRAAACLHHWRSTAIPQLLATR